MTEEFEGLTDEQFVEQLRGYLEEHYITQILALLPSSTYIQSLESHDMNDFFMKRPDTFVTLLKRAVIDIIIENNAGFSSDNIEKEYMNLKVKLSSESRQKLSGVGAESVNSPIVFNCVITGLNPREVYIERASLKCPKGCAEGEMNVSCNSKRELPFMACLKCGEQLIVVSDRSIYKYFQRAVLQEPPEESKKGNPLESDAVLTDLQVGDATVGDRKQIVGILRPLVDKKSLLLNQHKLIIDVKSIEDLEGQNELMPTPEEVDAFKLASKSNDFLTKLAKSFSPEIFADDLLLDVKKTMLLCMAGGVKTDRKRGDINILLLGDPSMAKSTLLKFANTIVKKSMYASGRGSSAAGLTIGIVKRHDGTSIAQAGVLPLCNHGFAFIDELDKMNPNDRSGLHETMEQQCYDDQTEILTENGWKFFKDLTKTEKVATLHNNELKYVKPTSYFNSVYNGVMYDIKSRQVDLSVTPNHNMFVDIKYGDKWCGFKLIKICDLLYNKVRFKNDNMITNSININNHITNRDYNGRIYCVEVPNHIIYVRRGGKPVWCGNSVTIAKAGITMTLPAQTAIIAAANPKGGKWNDNIPVVDNINLMPTLLSRFDLKWCIRDIVARGTDELKASHILDEYSNEITTEYSPDDLQKFLNYVRKLRPVLSKEAKEELRKFYVKIRQKSVAEEQAIIDTRQIESLIRMAFAHAKIHFKDIVDMDDINVITSLYESSLASFGFDLQTGNVHQKTFEQGDRDNQIEMWWKVWSIVADEHGYVDYKSFFDELLKYDKMWTENKAEQFWNKLHRDGRLLMTRNGWKRI